LKKTVDLIFVHLECIGKLNLPNTGKVGHWQDIECKNFVFAFNIVITTCKILQ